jgi:hypothetical protein
MECADSRPLVVDPFAGIDLDPLPATTLIAVGSAVVGFVVSAFLVRTGLRQAQRL